MKKKIIVFLLAAVPALCGASGGFFTSFEGGAAFTVNPHNLSDNNTGVYDTARGGASAGWSFYDWADVYGGAGFAVFFDRIDKESHYSFVPLFAGLRVNIMPGWIVFPSLSAEAGAAFANRHAKVFDMMSMSYVDTDSPYEAFYYNLGLSINYRLNDKALLGLKISRLSFSLPERGELHAACAGLEVKVLY